MRRGIRSFCNGDASTSTLTQHNTNINVNNNTPDYHGCGSGGGRGRGRGRGHDSSFIISSTTTTTAEETPPSTLEEMILQLELEEEIARKAKLQEIYGETLITQQQQQKRRMSCVNNSDILRSARNALNQYPRFSLDGKDAMYRSSFRNNQLAPAGRKSICCSRAGRCSNYYSRDEDEEFQSKSKPKSKLEKMSRCSTYSSLGGAGESVIWCKAGVVAKLMGLELMPVPVSKNKQNLKRRDRDRGRYQMERRRRF